jgi:hypothetical protein
MSVYVFVSFVAFVSFVSKYDDDPDHRLSDRIAASAPPSGPRMTLHRPDAM